MHWQSINNTQDNNLLRLHTKTRDSANEQLPTSFEYIYFRTGRAADVAASVAAMFEI